MVLGNKLDLAEQNGKRRVNKETAEDFCKTSGDMLFYETSAKTSINVMTGFTALAKAAVKIQEEQLVKNSSLSGTGRIRRPTAQTTKKSKNLKGMRL